MFFQHHNNRTDAMMSSRLSNIDPSDSWSPRLRKNTRTHKTKLVSELTD